MIMINTDYEAIDLRGLSLPDMGTAVHTVAELKQTYTNVRSVIISRSQRETLVRSDPQMYTAALHLEQQFEKPMSDLDFVMIIEGCRVEVE